MSLSSTVPSFDFSSPTTSQFLLVKFLSEADFYLLTSMVCLVCDCLNKVKLMGYFRAYIWHKLEFLFWAGILLLEELVAVFDMDGLRLIVEAVQQRLAEASQGKAQGRTDWWKAKTKQCTASLHVFAAFFFSCFLFLTNIPVFYLICRRQIATVLLFPCLTFILVWQLREASILAIGTVANYLHEAKVLQCCSWWLRHCSVSLLNFLLSVYILRYLRFVAVLVCSGRLVDIQFWALLGFHFERGSWVRCVCGLMFVAQWIVISLLSCIFQFMNFQCDSIPSYFFQLLLCCCSRNI